MKLNIVRLLAVIAITGVSVTVFPRAALCRLNLPQIQEQTTIEGRDNQVLREFFTRAEKDGPTRLLSDSLKRLLIDALPQTYKDGCSGMVDQWGAAAQGTAGLSVRLLHTEGTKEGRPIALLAFTCSSRAREYADRFRDERLGAIVVGPATSRLSMIPQDKECDDCPELTRITPEKDVHIGGRSIVGLSFLKSNENPCCVGGDPYQEERVYFYLLQDSGVKPAGSVLKGRVEYDRRGEKGGGKMVYNAGIVFKKDMKGNIVGILSPYTTETNDRRTDKGMVRYNWDGARGEFVKE